MMHAIETRGLAKSYGKLRALQPLDLKVRLGCCFGLLGPNGAGKSTLVKTLLGIVHATAGEASLLGRDWRQPESRRSVGYLPEGHRFPRYLTGREVCSYFGHLSGLSGAHLKHEIDKKLATVGMANWGDAKIPKYSKGMMQRLGLAQAMLGDPQLIILDEPTDGVDPTGRHEMRGVVREYAAANRTVFINSHLLSEVEVICDEIAILHKGKMIRHDTVSAIKASVEAGKTGTTVRFQTGPLSDATWQTLSAFKPEKQPDQWFTLTVADREGVNPIIDQLRRSGVPIYAIEPVRASLEDAFIEVITDQGDTSVGGVTR